MITIKLNGSLKSNLVSLDGGDTFMYLSDYCKLADDGTISDIEYKHGCLPEYLDEEILSKIIKRRMDKYGGCSIYEYLKDYLKITKKPIIVNWKPYTDCRLRKFPTIRLFTFPELRGRFYTDKENYYTLK